MGLVIGQLTRGGAEGQLVELAIHLRGTRFEPFVYVLSTHTQPLGDTVVGAGVPLRVLSGPPVRRVRTLAQALRADGIELVHSWLYLANPIAALAARVAGGLPVVTAARNCKVHGQVNRLANVWAFRSSRRIVVNSRDVYHFIVQRYWAPRERIRVVPNGIDLHRFKPGSCSSSDPPRIVTVGRLVAQKNHRLFLQAAAALHARRPDVRFAIVGDGPLRSELEAQRAQLCLSDAVEFLGERDDVETVLQSAKVFWLTSSWEGMPNVVLEALACGLPVIASDVSGVRELLNGSGAGVVVEGSEPHHWVEPSLRLLDQSEELRAARQAARQRAAEFSLSRMVERTTQIYLEAAS